MADIFGTGAVDFKAKSAAEAASMGNAIEMLRQLSMGASISLSGADFAETVQQLQTLAILEMADKLGV